MKMFTKLALVSSMAISAHAMALQSMDDAALSATTGQDGINIGIGISKVEIDRVLIHDNDGLATGATTPQGTTIVGGKGKAGAIVIGDPTNDSGSTAPTVKGIVITPNSGSLLTNGNLANLVIDTDAGTGNTGAGLTPTGTAFLNVAAEVSGLNINIGKISVSGSNGAGSGAIAGTIRRGNDVANYNEILSGLTLTTGKMDANIQLGATPQGAMIILNTTMQGGLTLSNLGIKDNSTAAGAGTGADLANRAAGEIHLDSIKVADASGANLTIDAKVSVVGKAGTNNGYLQIVTGTSATAKASDIYIAGVHLGSAGANTSIGDVEVQGLQTYYNPTHTAGADVKGSAITISGH